MPGWTQYTIAMVFLATIRSNHLMKVRCIPPSFEHCNGAMDPGVPQIRIKLWGGIENFP